MAAVELGGRVVLVSPLVVTVRYDPASQQLEVKGPDDPGLVIEILSRAWYATLATVTRVQLPWVTPP